MLTKDKILDNIKSIYNFCNSKYMWGVLIALIVLALIIDILPMYQVRLWILEETGKDIIDLYNVGVEIFDYEIEVLIAILSVIWAFMVGFSSIFIDKIDNRFYGMRIAYVIQQYMGSLIGIVVMSIIQLVLMVIGTVFEFRVMLCMLFPWLLNTMIVLFLFILTHFFRTTILELVSKTISDVVKGKQQFQDASILLDLINNLDYKKKDEVKTLETILIQRIFKAYEEEGEDKESSSRQKFTRKESKFYQLAYDVTSEILNDFTHDEGEIRSKLTIITNWFDNRENYFCIQAGILSALMDAQRENFAECCKKLLKGVKNEKRYRKLRIWMITYELHKSQYIDQEWRHILAQLAFQEYIRMVSSDDEQLFVRYWQTLNGIGVHMNVLYDFLKRV